MISQKLTILFSDISSSTQLYRKLGDAAAHQTITDCLARQRALINQFQGRLLRTVGDGVMASFRSADNALLAAIEIMRRDKLPLRVGLHVGEVIPDDGDIYGDAVNIAARINDYSRQHEICASLEVIQELSVAMRPLADWLDNVQLRGISEPLTLYRIRWAEDSADTALAGRPDALNETRVPTLQLGCEQQELMMNRQQPLVTLGRGQENDLITQHPSASRLHGRIELQQTHYELTDSSTNGCWVSTTIGATATDLPIFVHRGKLRLERQGYIGLGWQPSRDWPGISYKILMESP